MAAHKVKRWYLETCHLTARRKVAVTSIIDYLFPEWQAVFVRGASVWSGLMKFKGGCHCGAIRIELLTERQPQQQVIGACHCSFCRKHNARTFSDPKAFVTLTAHEPEHLRRYEFGLKTSEQILCARCGVYVAMTLIEADQVFSVISIDALDDRALFNREPEPRDYSAEDRIGRIERRKARWTPTTLIGWPISVS